jgi:aspartate ammonia-lyase
MNRADVTKRLRPERLTGVEPATTAIPIIAVEDLP